MVLKHTLLAAVFTGIAATASAQTAPPANHPVPQTATRDTTAPTAADAGKLIGRNVKNTNNDTVGEISSVYLDAGGKVDSVIVAVGGFLGVGERYARLHWNDLQVSDNGERVVVNMTKDQLKAMAPYKYKDDTMRGKVFSDRGVWRDDRAGNTESTGDFNAQGNVSANAVIGAKVRNASNDTVGSVQDLYVDSSGNIKAVVLSIGGFFGSKDVAVKWTDIKQNRDGKSVKLTTTLSKDQLNSLPDYKYDRREPNQAAAPK